MTPRQRAAAPRLQNHLELAVRHRQYVFETDMAEFRTGKLHMPDADGTIIDLFLKFLYTDALPEDVSDLDKKCRSLLLVASI